ncbi:MAG: PKD domain-containing protein [candidate division Zixibacteria bacterium]|nr:PKD domain-containing protein [candidate division Zixibacteria bacterium]
MTRRGYYACNSVPWIVVNGTTIDTDEDVMMDAVIAGILDFAPFNIELTPLIYSNNTIDVQVTITRDPTDPTPGFENIRLRVGLVEKQVDYDSPPGSNGESTFYDVCRKMIYDASGEEFVIPEPGQSTELDLLYIPTDQALIDVDFSDVRIVAFIQDDDSGQVYQSATQEVEPSDQVHAAFRAVEILGAPGFTAQFEDFSTPTSSTNIVSWAWDFDDDGVPDSAEPEPTRTYNDEGLYAVSLTVSDGTDEDSRTMVDYIIVVGASSNILVVNGIEYNTYIEQMESFYNSSAPFGDHQVDIWDLFGEQGFDYGANTNIDQVTLLQHYIPNSILFLYQKVVWIGNSYGGDEQYYYPDQVLEYITHGGNFLLATREGEDFFDQPLQQYCGISNFSGLFTMTNLQALDENLVDIPVLAGADNSRAHLVQFDENTEATAIFAEETEPGWVAGFRVAKENEGEFIYIAGRPYRYDNEAQFLNYDFILENWMNFETGLEDSPATDFISPARLYQNRPNPFNPSTQISFSLAQDGPVTLKIFDAGGRLIKTLLNAHMEANYYELSWDGTSDEGISAASGVYFYQLKTTGANETKRMVLLK